MNPFEIISGFFEFVPKSFSDLFFPRRPGSSFPVASGPERAGSRPLAKGRADKKTFPADKKDRPIFLGKALILPAEAGLFLSLDLAYPYDALGGRDLADEVGVDLGIRVDHGVGHVLFGLVGEVLDVDLKKERIALSMRIGRGDVAGENGKHDRPERPERKKNAEGEKKNKRPNNKKKPAGKRPDKKGDKDRRDNRNKGERSDTFGSSLSGLLKDIKL